MNLLTFIVLPNEYALCRLEVNDTVPAWALSSSFYTISKTTDELSVVCETTCVPEGIKFDKGWRLLKIAAVLDLSLTGITAKFSTALANAGVNLCVIATYDTDYIMVKEEKLLVAIEALEHAGFIVNQ
jgi:uncharacterized protein